MRIPPAVRRMPSCLRRLIVFACCVMPALAAAQVPGYNHKQFRIEQFDANHFRLTGQVELENEDVKGQKFYADVVDVFETAEEPAECAAAQSPWGPAMHEVCCELSRARHERLQSLTLAELQERSAEAAGAMFYI